MTLQEKFSATVNIANQSSSYSNREYYAPTSLFRGNATSPVRKGEPRFFDNKNEFKLYEVYGRYNNEFGNVNLLLQEVTLISGTTTLISSSLLEIFHPMGLTS